MRGFYFLAALAAALLAPSVKAQEKVEKLDSIVVSASRAGKATPVTYTMVNRDDLRASSPLNSLPMTLNLQPSVVTSVEGGTGLGYSKLTIRGSKGSQINVTLNGITLNDAESQEVFWVNIPALTSLLSSVQVQRGLGTSANGAGAFGASINMSTASVGAEPTGRMELSFGSYGTFIATASASTGLLPGGWYAQGAYSRGYTKGYIRNAKADVQSALAVVGKMWENNSFRLTWLMGEQHTGITWLGISREQMEKDRTYNPAGAYYDALGNEFYYDNETDNYCQHHLQANFTHRFPGQLTWSTTLNYTKGDGYFENYMDDAMPETFGIGVQPSYSSDFIVRQEMDNSYSVLNSTLTYRGDALDVTGGLYLSRYNGDVFGNVLWSDRWGKDYDYSRFSWFRNNGKRNEVNVFLRSEYRPSSSLTAFVDLQYRCQGLKMSGPAEDFVPTDYDHVWHFFNPRAGLTWTPAPGHKVYGSAALGHREPGRNDLKAKIESVYLEHKAGNPDATVDTRPEEMLDIELGYTFESATFSASANLYLMEYWDMLLETGKLSPVGYAIKENVPRSWRRGVELAAAWQPSPVLRLGGNLTLSINQIKDYTFYREHYDNMTDWNPLPQIREDYGRVTMLMSPSVVGMGQVVLRPFALRGRGSLKTTEVRLDGKYVGKQYWDNTQNDDRSIPAYFVMNLGVSHRFSIGEGSLELGAYVNNLLNRKYFSDAWGYRPYFDVEKEAGVSEGVFPQAPANVMVKVVYSFN